MIKVPLGEGGMVFLGEVVDGVPVYRVGFPSEIGRGPVFRRADLAHIRAGAAGYDPRAETDVVYDGPAFRARRVCKAPLLFGVHLFWKFGHGEREFFFQGEEWNAFLQVLESICASERVT